MHEILLSSQNLERVLLGIILSHLKYFPPLFVYFRDFLVEVMQFFFKQLSKLLLEVWIRLLVLLLSKSQAQKTEGQQGFHEEKELLNLIIKSCHL